MWRYWSWFSMELFKSAWCFKFLLPWTLSLHPFVELAFWDELLLAQKKMTPNKSPKRVANDAKENMEHLDSVLGCHLHSGAPGKKRGQLVSAEELWYQMQSNIMQPFSSLGFLGISWFRQLQTEKERNEIKEVELQKQETLSCRHSFSHFVGQLLALTWEGHIWMILHASNTILWNFPQKNQARYLRTMAARKSIQDFPPFLDWDGFLPVVLFCGRGGC